MRTRTLTSALLALAAVLVLAACGSDNNNDNTTATSGGATTTATRGYGDKTIQPVQGAASTPPMTVGSKNFTEEFILGNIYAQALQAAGYNVKKQFNLGSEQIALKAVKANKVGMYPEYTGTVITSFCGVKPADESHDADQAYQQAKTCMAKQSIDAGSGVDLNTGLQIERAQFAALFATEDRAIGMRSFVEKRTGRAPFVGR